MMECQWVMFPENLRDIHCESHLVQITGLRYHHLLRCHVVKVLTKLIVKHWESHLDQNL